MLALDEFRGEVADFWLGAQICREIRPDFRRVAEVEAEVNEGHVAAPREFLQLLPAP